MLLFVRPEEDGMLYSRIMPETCINKAVATMAPLPKTVFLINLNTTRMHKHKNKHSGIRRQSEKAPQIGMYKQIKIQTANRRYTLKEKTHTCANKLTL